MKQRCAEVDYSRAAMEQPAKCAVGSDHHHVVLQGSKGAVQGAVQSVTSAIERGTFLQQVTSVFILRLTPVVPFRCASAS